MAPSINIASVIFLETDGISGLFVVDQFSGRAYRLSVLESDPIETGKVMMAITGQMRANTPRIPVDDIAQMVRTERDVTRESSDKFKNRSGDARS
jgi:hypothetical protein